MSASPFHVCQATCLCAPSPQGYGQGKVLYCFGEVGFYFYLFTYSTSFGFLMNVRRLLLIHFAIQVVLNRANLMPEEEEGKKEQEEEEFYLQLVQMVTVTILLMAMSVTVFVHYPENIKWFSYQADSLDNNLEGTEKVEEAVEEATILDINVSTS